VNRERTLLMTHYGREAPSSSNSVKDHPRQIIRTEQLQFLRVGRFRVDFITSDYVFRSYITELQE